MCSLINTIAFLMVCNLASMAGAVAVSDASQGHVFVLVEAFCIFLMVLVEAFMMRGGCTFITCTRDKGRDGDHLHKVHSFLLAKKGVFINGVG